MTAGSLLGTLAVVGIATASGPVWFMGAWMFAGLAQAALFYQPAFAALTHWYGLGRVRALTILTLAAGLSRTVFAPLTAALQDHLSCARPTYCSAGCSRWSPSRCTPPSSTRRGGPTPAQTSRASAMSRRSCAAGRSSF